MEPSTGLSLVVVVAYRPVSWEGTKPRDSLPALRPINLHSNPCLHPLGTCLLREPESCSLLSFFFFCQSCLWDSSTEIFLGKRGFFHTCRTPAMPHKKNWWLLLWRNVCSNHLSECSAPTNACLKLFSKPWKVKVTLTNLEQNYVHFTVELLIMGNRLGQPGKKTPGLQIYIFC